MRATCLFRAHQVGYPRTVWCEACPTFFPKIFSSFRHVASCLQVLLNFCFGTPYYEAYTGRASGPPGGASKEEEECEAEASGLARGLPPCSRWEPLPRLHPLSGLETLKRGWVEPPLEVLPLSVWSPTSRGVVPPPAMPNEVTGGCDRFEAAGSEDSLLS